jgi:hypothetical protein
MEVDLGMGFWDFCCLAWLDGGLALALAVTGMERIARCGFAIDFDSDFCGWVSKQAMHNMA